MFDIIRYSDERQGEWNEFVSKSKNGTFLLDRNYMDYHADRFTDHSLMFYLKNKLYAVLPANASGETLFSHQGLTYGGLIMGTDATAANILILFQELNETLRISGFRRVVYKAVPWIYHSVPAEEDLYAVIKECGASIIARDISSAIIMSRKPKFKELRRRCVKKAAANGLTVAETDDIEGFWSILNENLTNKYGTSPVHTKEELRLLKSRFPQNIKLYAAFQNGIMLGGTLLYITPQVVHTQYISANETGKREGALDLVFDHLINNIYSHHTLFDFGKSTEDCGKVLNESLIHQKEGFGGRGVCYDWYEWKL